MDNDLRHTYILKFNESELFLGTEESSVDSGMEYVVPFRGQIIFRREDLEEGFVPNAQTDRVIGRFQGYVIHAARALNDGIDLWDHCDAHSQDICNYATAFYDEDGDFKEEIAQAFRGGGDGLNLLIIDEIAIHPDHRRRLVGLRTLSRLMEVLGNDCGFAATIPYPLQFQEDNVGEFEQHPERNKKRAEQNLALYIDRIDFERLPNSHIYAWSLSRKAPNLEVVGRPAKVLPLH